MGVILDHVTASSTHVHLGQLPQRGGVFHCNRMSFAKSYWTSSCQLRHLRYLISHRSTFYRYETTSSFEFKFLVVVLSRYIYSRFVSVNITTLTSFDIFHDLACGHDRVYSLAYLYIRQSLRICIYSCGSFSCASCKVCILERNLFRGGVSRVTPNSRLDLGVSSGAYVGSNL